MSITKVEFDDVNEFVTYRNSDNYLHNEFGPAKIWYDGYKLYCINGTEILFITENGCWGWLDELSEIEKEKYVHQFGCKSLMVGSELEKE